MANQRDASIKNNTNYIFIYGKAGVGKSTLFGAICNYLLQESIYNIVPNINNYKSIAVLNNWVAKLNSSIFPARTPPGSLIQVEAALQDGEHYMPISLLEMSGEDLSKGDFSQYDFENDKFSGLSKPFEELITASNIFILMTSIKDGKKHDNYLWQFLVKLHFLTRQSNKPIYVALIVTHWDEVDDEYQQDEEGIIDFVRDNMKLTFNQIEKKIVDNCEIFPFSVGKVRYDSDTEEEEEEGEIDEDFSKDAHISYIDELSFKYCEAITSWLLDAVEATNNLND